MSSRTFNPVVGNSRPCMMSVAIQKVQSSTNVRKRFAWILFLRHRISLIMMTMRIMVIMIKIKLGSQRVDCCSKVGLLIGNQTLHIFTFDLTTHQARQAHSEKVKNDKYKLSLIYKNFCLLLLRKLAKRS